MEYPRVLGTTICRGMEEPSTEIVAGEKHCVASSSTRHINNPSIKSLVNNEDNTNISLILATFKTTHFVFSR